MSTASDKHNSSDVVTWGDLDEFMHDYHSRRWKVLGIWAFTFSLIVTSVLVGVKHEAAQRKTDRDAQLAAIVSTGHQECVRAFQAMTTILRASIPPDRVNHATAKEAALIAKLFKAADAKTNCPPDSTSAKDKKILRQTSTEGDK